MSKQEAKTLKKTGKLEDIGNDLIPIFDNTRIVEDKLRRMDGDKLRNYFRSIGVRNPQVVAFFEIYNEKEIVGPIPQKNGLREYKAHSGTRINEYSSIRV